MTMYMRMSRYETVIRIEILESRFDARVGDALVHCFTEVSEEMFNRVILDLGTVEFMDSSGLGAIVNLWKRFRDCKELCIANVNPPVRNFLYMTRMDYVLPISEDAAEAPAAA